MILRNANNLDPCFSSSGRKVVYYILDSIQSCSEAVFQLEPEKTADPVAQEVL